MMIFLTLIDDEQDKDLFVQIYEEYRVSLLRYAYSFLPSKLSGYAEDVIQDAFIAVAKNINTIKEIDCSKLKAFLVCIVKHKAIDVIRAEKHTADISTDDIDFCTPDNGPAPIDIIVSDAGFQHLKDCIHNLSDTYREVLELKLIYKLSDVEIGNMLGIAPKTVNVRVFRGKIKLKEMLLQEGR